MSAPCGATFAVSLSIAKIGHVTHRVTAMVPTTFRAFMESPSQELGLRWVTVRNAGPCTQEPEIEPVGLHLARESAARRAYRVRVRDRCRRRALPSRRSQPTLRACRARRAALYPH